VADGPWNQYQQRPSDQGPWKKYAAATPDAKSEETYGEKVKRTGDVFEQKAGTGLAGVGRTAVAAGEIAESAFTGVAGDIAGAATSVFTQDPKKGESVRKAITTEPATEAGKAGQEYIGALTEPIAKVVGYVPKKLDEAGHPILAQSARAALDVAGGKKALETKAETLAKVPGTIAEEAVHKARAAGYVLKPSEAGGKVGKVAEGVTGSPRLSIEASLRNQPVTNKLAGQEVGIPEGGRVTRGSLSEAKKPHNEIYKEVGKLGEITTDDAYKNAINGIGRTPGKSFPKVSSPDIERLREQYRHEESFEASDAVLEVRRLRAASTKNIKAPNQPAQNELGYAQKQIADAIEDQIERHATAAGNPALVDALRYSRQQLAKIHTVQASLMGNTGDVSAVKLAQMQKKGVPLSGNLKLIADTADEFGESMRDASKVKNKVPVTVLEGAAGAFGAGVSGAHPVAGAAALGGMVARPLTRKALLSEWYQNKLAPGPKKASTVADLDSR
jgi:hypothetical protein